MRHPDEGTIHAWLDGALDDADAAWLESHARECSACGALVAEARGLVAGASRVLGALDMVPGGVIPARDANPVGPRATPHEPVTARGIRIEAMRSGLRQQSRWAVPARAAAALLLVAGGTFMVMNSTSMADHAAPMAAMARDIEASTVVRLPGVMATDTAMRVASAPAAVAVRAP